MNLFSIAFKSIRQRGLASSLTALSVALGVTLMVSVLVIDGVMRKVFNQSASGYDLVIGAKGSPLQLVLNTIFHVSAPIENLPYTYYKKLKADPRVEHAIPFCLGDRAPQGDFRIVGTIPEFFETEYMPGQLFRVKGSFLHKPFDAVIGSQVASENGWPVGHEFTPVHGVGDHHHEEKFKVVGILAPTGTPNDKVVYVHLDGFYQIAGHEKPLEEAQAKEKAFAGKRKGHAAEADDKPANPAPEKPKPVADAHHHHGHDHHHHELPDEQKEVTAILVQAKHKILAISLDADINEEPDAQAANPAKEIRWLMTNVVGNVAFLLVVMISLIIVVSGVGIFVSIYNSMADRRREIAIMRALGARRGTVFSIILAESVLLCLGGGLLGVLLGHGLVLFASPLVAARSGIVIDPFRFEWMEVILLPSLILLAALIGVVPGMTAYRTDVARTLAK